MDFAESIYSGVPVYEMEVNRVAIMRRRSDGWLNATQILKNVKESLPGTLPATNTWTLRNVWRCDFAARTKRKAEGASC